MIYLFRIHMKIKYSKLYIINISRKLKNFSVFLKAFGIYKHIFPILKSIK
jgi:hypothetical protein